MFGTAKQFTLTSLEEESVNDECRYEAKITEAKPGDASPNLSAASNARRERKMWGEKNHKTLVTFTSWRGSHTGSSGLTAAAQVSRHSPESQTVIWEK